MVLRILQTPEPGQFLKEKDSDPLACHYTICHSPRYTSYMKIKFPSENSNLKRKKMSQNEKVNVKVGTTVGDGA